MTPEGLVKKKIDEVLKKLDIYYFKPRGTTLGRSGIPDYVCCYKGRFVAIEAKAGNGKLTGLQYQEAMAIAKHQGQFIVVNDDNIKDLESFLTAFVNLPIPAAPGGCSC